MDMCISKILGRLGQQARKKIKVTRSWGSHGISVSGIYWERWTGSNTEVMTEFDFKKECSRIEQIIGKDWSEMVAGDQRPVYHLAKQS